MNGQKIDANMQRLVEVLNGFTGIGTLESCGGHPAPRSHQWPEGEWYLQFEVDHSEHGWFALEFITWVVTDYVRSGHNVILYPVAPPPYLNTPGSVLSFVLEGHGGEDPNDLAVWMDKTRRAYYIPPVDRSRSREMKHSFESFQETPATLRAAEIEASKRVRPWQMQIRTGDFVVIQPEQASSMLIYGEIVADEDPDAPPLPRHRRWARCYSLACPDGEYKFIHVSEILGVITPITFERVREQEWSPDKQMLLTLVATDSRWQATAGSSLPEGG